jgi:hypothetical protein
MHNISIHFLESLTGFKELHLGYNDVKKVDLIISKFVAATP